MKVLKIGIILVLLLCVLIIITQLVNAEEETNAAIDVNTITLPQLQFDEIQEKVTVDNELSPDYNTIVTSMVMSAIELKESTNSKIPVGAIIHHSNDGVTRVFDSSGKQILYAEDIKAGKIATPSGFKPATHVHEVPSGSVIQSKNNVLFVTYQKKLILSIISENNEELLATESSSSVLGVTDRWIEWVKTFYLENMGIGEFTARWKVPAAPKKTHVDYSSGYTSVIHLFNGIGNSNGLVQPVLSWHYAKSPSIPRPLSWTGAAWALWGDTADIHSPSINVAVGDDIQGHMKWDKVQKLWYIKFTDQTTGEITNLYSGVVSDNEVYLYPGVLECFFTEPGNDYLPGNAIFSNFIIKKENEKTFTPKLDLPEYQDTLINQFRLIKGANGLFVDIDSWPNKIILYTAYPPPIFIISPNSGNYGTITPSLPVTVQAGGRQTFIILPDQGYVVEDVKVNKESVGAVTSYTFENVQQDSTIRATFKKQSLYTITPTAGIHGTISPSTPQKVVSGGSQTFTITANPGYVISDVLVDGASVGTVNSYTFKNVQANHRIRATFKPSSPTFTITASAGSGGSISPSGSVIVPAGVSQTFTIKSDSGYVVDEVLIDGISQGRISTYTFDNVQGDHTISAVFKSALPLSWTKVIPYDWTIGSMGATDKWLFVGSDDTEWTAFVYAIDENGNYYDTNYFKPYYTPSIARKMIWSSADGYVYIGGSNGDFCVINRLNNPDNWWEFAGQEMFGGFPMYENSGSISDLTEFGGNIIGIGPAESISFEWKNIYRSTNPERTKWEHYPFIDRPPGWPDYPQQIVAYGGDLYLTSTTPYAYPNGEIYRSSSGDMDDWSLIFSVGEFAPTIDVAGGQMFIGTLGTGQDGKIYRYSGSSFSEVFDATSYGTGLLYCFAECEGIIYAGGNGGNLFYSHDGGSTWSLAHHFGDIDVIYALQEFKGHIYAAGTMGVYKGD